MLFTWLKTKFAVHVIFTPLQLFNTKSLLYKYYVKSSYYSTTVYVVLTRTPDVSHTRPLHLRLTRLFLEGKHSAVSDVDEADVDSLVHGHLAVKCSNTLGLTVSIRRINNTSS